MQKTIRQEIRQDLANIGKAIWYHKFKSSILIILTCMITGHILAYKRFINARKILLYLSELTDFYFKNSKQFNIALLANVNSIADICNYPLSSIINQKYWQELCSLCADMHTMSCNIHGNKPRPFSHPYHPDYEQHKIDDALHEIQKQNNKGIINTKSCLPESEMIELGMIAMLRSMAQIMFEYQTESAAWTTNIYNVCSNRALASANLQIALEAAYIRLQNIKNR